MRTAWSKSVFCKSKMEAQLNLQSTSAFLLYQTSPCKVVIAAGYTINTRLTQNVDLFQSFPLQTPACPIQR